VTTAGPEGPDDRIARIAAWSCSVPVDEPFRLGSMVIDRRDFVIVRVDTEGGLTSGVCSLSRSAPVDLVVLDVLAAAVLGQDPRDIPAARERLGAATVALGHDGIVQRGISFLDVALWDLKAQGAGLPLWRMLGGFQTQVPVMVVAGYPRSGESADVFGRRVAEGADGFPAVKLARAGDNETMARRVAACRAALGDGVEIVIDAAWALGGVREALAFARAVEPFGVTFIEDPFPAGDVEAYAALRDASPVAIAAGDEVAQVETLARLVDAGGVDVLRVDGMTAGGVTGFLETRVHARRRKVARISPHIAPELHQHFAFAFGGVTPVEMFPPGSPFFGVDKLVAPASLDLRDGTLHAPETPGVGMRIDWDAVEGLALRHGERTG
jgi:L-alanine-DL-glutamate epimerase-like enolase superfamily enzyme